MEYQFIKYSLNNNIGVIRLNRPDKLNSFNREMALESIDALNRLSQDEYARVILIIGEGRAFSAGQDLDEAISGKYQVTQIVREQYNPIIKIIRQAEKPVIAAVNGIAAGAGANIAFACDIVIASNKASFIQSFSKIGLIPDSGGTYFLPRLVGMSKAAAIMMSGEKISAEDAVNMNLIYKCVDSNEFESFINDFAIRIASMPTRALALTKEAMRKSFDNTLESQLELEQELQSIASDSYDYKEGVKAFLEKRNPIFIGK